MCGTHANIPISAAEPPFKSSLYIHELHMWVTNYIRESRTPYLPLLRRSAAVPPYYILCIHLHTTYESHEIYMCGIHANIPVSAAELPCWILSIHPRTKYVSHELHTRVTNTISTSAASICCCTAILNPVHTPTHYIWESRNIYVRHTRKHTCICCWTIVLNPLYTSTN